MNLKADRTKFIALVATVVIVCLTVTWMTLSYLNIGSRNRQWPPEHKVDISIDNEEFVEILDMPSPRANLDAASKAYDEIAENNISTPEEMSGPDLEDNGPEGEAAPVTTSERPSPVKAEKKPQPKKTGPAEDKAAKEADEARRKARQALSGAFKGTGKNNTSNPTGKTTGNSGAPEGVSSAVNGRLVGSVGNGWSLPGYGTVTSPVKGTVKVRITINPDGSVHRGDVEFIGGTPPAATNPTTRANILKELISKRFTRSSGEVSEKATAYITVSF